MPWAPLLRPADPPGGSDAPKLEQGISHMYAFIGLDGTADELQLRSSNLWVLPAGERFNIEKGAADYYAHPTSALADGRVLMFIGFPSVKDPSFATRHPGKSTCVIITEARREWFAEWAGVGQPGKRHAPDYEDKKATFEKALLEGLHRFFPKTRGRVAYLEMGSPLTNEHYLQRAASYGLAPTPTRFTAPLAATIRPAVGGVPGLFLSGHDLTTAGWAGALSAGIVTAMGVLGYGFWDTVVCGRDVVRDICHLPTGEGAPVKIHRVSRDEVVGTGAGAASGSAPAAAEE